MNVRNHIESHSIPVTESGCWLWLGSLNANGYGRIKIDGLCTSAHRASFLAHGGVLTVNQYACHKCDTRTCVNPDHIFAGDAKENANDMVRKGRSLRGAKHNLSRLTNEDVLKIRKSAKNQKDRNAMAMCLGVSFKTVEDILLGKTWKHLPLDTEYRLDHSLRDWQAVGERHGCSKFTDNDRRQIALRRTLGESNEDLAKEYGVHRTTITKAEKYAKRVALVKAG